MVDIYSMGTTTFEQRRSKECPFCSEAIRTEAIKCRYCAEFLDTREAKAVEAKALAHSAAPEDTEYEYDVLYEGRPSLFGMVGAGVKAAFFLALAALVIYWPLEKILNKPLNLGLDEAQMLVVGEYRVLAGLGLAVLVALLLFLKVFKLKMTRYEVTAERIEWSRGILDRKVDNLDMFRVIDLKLRRSLLDCILGIGTVELITTDKTDPKFTFEKMRHSRQLYDVIKKASLEADRRDGVVHFE